MCGISIRPGKVWKWWTRLASAVVVASGSAALAAPTVLDFEDLAPGTEVTTQYGSRGVLFQQAFLDSDTAAHSPTRVLRTFSPSSEVFVPIPLKFSFTSAQARVKLFAGVHFAPVMATLKVFDANESVVGQDGPKMITVDAFTTTFEVTTTTPVIRRAELQPEITTNLAIDDLEFDGEPPAPPPPTPPVVQITSPLNGAELDVSVFDIAGTVTGEGLISPVKVTITFLRPPEQSSAPPFRSDLSLTGTGTTRQFSLPGGFNNPPLGPITVTVTAENFAGLKGTATSTFTNLPDAIRDRFLQELLAGRPLGDFRFGLFETGCKIAVYANGAISDANLLIRGDILTKWLSLRLVRISPRPSDNRGLGCPLGEEADGPGDSRIQNFRDGRIYTNLPGTAYVPNVFLDVLDTRELEILGPPTSVPLADPVSPVEPFAVTTQTWLFQQFIRPGRPDLLPATLEIQGSPPILWIERQSGTSSARMGALWDHFPCDGNLGPCAVQAPPSDFIPIQNAGDTFCGGVALRSTEGEFSLFANCTAADFNTDVCGRHEWQHIKADEYLQTAIFGVVTDSHFAGEDFTGSHEWCDQTQVSFDPRVALNPAHYLDCPSDWNVIVAPIGPQPGVAPHQSLFAEGNEVSGIGVGNSSSSRLVELEYERFYGDFVEWMGRPVAGDLIFAVGRWIIDCGHDTFKSELHPLYMYSKMKTVTSITDPFTGLVNNNPFGGQPATRADIWVNGWYPGGDDADHAIEFDIFPPPRPTPTARLVVNKPVDADAVHEVTIKYSLLQNHVHVKFTAPFRQNHVTVWGEVKWEINRGYEGQWYLFWAP